MEILRSSCILRHWRPRRLLMDLSWLSFSPHIRSASSNSAWRCSFNFIASAAAIWAGSGRFVYLGKFPFGTCMFRLDGCQFTNVGDGAAVQALFQAGQAFAQGGRFRFQPGRLQPCLQLSFAGFLGAFPQAWQSALRFKVARNPPVFTASRG